MTSIRGALLAFATFLDCAIEAQPLAEFEYLRTSDEQLTLEDIQARPGWQRRSPLYAFGFADEAIWIRFAVPSGTEVVSLHYAWNDRADLFFLSDGVRVTSFVSGALYPMSNRPIKDPTIAFPVAPGVDEVYIRAARGSSSFYPINLLTRQEFESLSATTSFLRGGYYGILVIMFVYNLALFVALRERFYGYFSCYTACLAVLLMTSDGTGLQLLFPENPELLHGLMHFALAGTGGFLGLFTIHFLGTQRHLPRSTTALRVYLAGLLGLATLTTFVVHMRELESLTVLATATALLWLGIVRWRQGDLYAPVFVIATGSLLVGAMLFVMVILGFLPGNTLLRNAAQFGSTAEVAILALVLASRVRTTQRQREHMRHRSFELARRVRELHTATQLAQEHRELQRSIQNAHKLRTIGQLTGGFAHEFNNILASILGFAELARDHVRDGKAAEYLAQVELASIRASELVKRLLSYANRGDRQSRNEIDVTEATNEAIALVRGTFPSTVDLRTKIAQNVRFTIDPEQLRDLMVNLCMNACEAMNERGAIDITLEKTVATDLTCSSCLTRFKGEHWVFKVEDEGPGLGSQVDDLFAPFYTTKSTGRGSGLGLSIVHGIAHEYGGHVTATSRAQGGSRFSVYVPVHRAQAAAPRLTERKRILLIEDDAAVGLYLKTLLDEAYEVTLANVPTDALERFMSMPTSFDLIITDQQMPHLTGLDIARDIHELRPEVPIILTSGNPSQFDINELAVMGIRDVFGKPLDAEHLLARISSLVGKTASRSTI